MFYLAAKHIAIKKNQDRADFDSNKIVLCDGIGEFEDSDKAATITLANLLYAESNQDIIDSVNKSASDIQFKKIIGGTTLVYAKVEVNENYTNIKIAYIGNGSAIHLNGDFHELPASYTSSNKPYRYTNHLIPHVDKDGVLLKHISHHSNTNDLTPSYIEFSFNGLNGDIVLLFTDGISSLEEDFIVVDEQNRIWRNQSENASLILDELHIWLKKNYTYIDQSNLDMFLENLLSGLKEKGKLEDDASIGIIFSDSVVNYYKDHFNVTKADKN